MDSCSLAHRHESSCVPTKDTENSQPWYLGMWSPLEIVCRCHQVNVRALGWALTNMALVLITEKAP